MQPVDATRAQARQAKELPMDILVPDIAITEKVVRSVGVYLFLPVAFRVAGKRQLGQLTAFDLVVLLVISNVLQNAAIGSDNSLGGGLVGASVIIALNWVVAWLTFRHKRLERMVKKEGVTTMSEVRYAILDEDGHVSVIPRRPVPA
jgi:uncharacterized membrane protein YcaP (DUF421 family)